MKTRNKVSNEFRARCACYIADGGFFNLCVARSMWQYAKQVKG